MGGLMAKTAWYWYCFAVECCGCWRCPRAFCRRRKGPEIPGIDLGGESAQAHLEKQAIRPLETATNDHVWSR